MKSSIGYLSSLLAISILAVGNISSAQVLNNHPSAQLVANATSATTVSLAFVLPLENNSELDSLLTRLYDPADPLYHHFLTTDEFISRYCPSEAKYNRLIQYAKAQGFTVANTHKNRLVLDVTANASVVNSLLKTRIGIYKSQDSTFYKPQTSYTVPAALSQLGATIIGLNSSPVYHKHSYLKKLTSPYSPKSVLNANISYSPSSIHRAYNIPANLNGSGQKIALFQLANYLTSDIQTYESNYGLPNVKLTNINVNGNVPRSDSSDEVTLDIEIAISIAPKISELLIYMTLPDEQGIIDGYNRIASDNLAKQVSTSWGKDEQYLLTHTNNLIASENPIFKQMAAQGQAMFAASGDAGANDNGSSLSVDDPAAQPYVTGVGGTSLTLGPGSNYLSETTWFTSSTSGSGGGFSSIWSRPSYQNGFVSNANRAIPDISIDADPNTGYPIYYTAPNSTGSWFVAGGTSAGAPVMAAFSALINQNLALMGKSNAGFLNPVLYGLAGNSTYYARDFHDIMDNSTNGFYHAVPGYDEATGLGTPNFAYMAGDIPRTASIPSNPVYSWPAGVYFIATPYDYTGTALSSAINDPSPLLYYYATASSKYITTPTSPADTFHQMRGYWVRYTTTVDLLITGSNLFSSSSDISLPLSPGWNMIGNPFNGPLPLSYVTIADSTNTNRYALNSNGALNYIYPVIYGYDPITGNYQAATTALSNFNGYWIKAVAPCYIHFTHP